MGGKNSATGEMGKKGKKIHKEGERRGAVASASKKKELEGTRVARTQKKNKHRKRRKLLSGGRGIAGQSESEGKMT